VDGFREGDEPDDSEPEPAPAAPPSREDPAVALLRSGLGAQVISEG
jgi:hypothetical protein